MPANGNYGYGQVFPKRMQPPAGAPRAPPNWKVGGHVPPRAPWFRRHWPWSSIELYVSLVLHVLVVIIIIIIIIINETKLNEGSSITPRCPKTEIHNRQLNLNFSKLNCTLGDSCHYPLLQSSEHNSSNSIVSMSVFLWLHSFSRCY